MQDQLLADVVATLANIPVDFGGGCSVSKAYVMAWLIRQGKIKASIDIGVYRGRSLFPQAVAHRACTGGLAYGVDPWSTNAAMQFDTPGLARELAAFARETDWDGIYAEVIAQRDQMGLAKHCQIIRKTSQDAAVNFTARKTRFGLIHIDGNHDAATVTNDVGVYLPLLAIEGFVVVDDVSWPSVSGALTQLRAETTLLLECITADKQNDYAVFWNGKSSVDRMMLTAALRQIALV